ncbi:antifreeze glycopeptide AFGP poly protein [Rhodotorula diobovata]|uniref:Antifreeze glycopeptide AFGP poly protein n=1 Tax=Rhodotorula diobovata TaxID=5288 RepID=A0A5C5FZW4_9BASI|nr:antifreeze glycopeptide AFGP poly protein [Rhodotorula diobovata]
MRTFSTLASLGSLAAIALAQSEVPIPAGYGRFPCSLRNDDGTLSADPNQCLDGALLPPGSADDSGLQGDGATPTGAQCVQAYPDGPYFCGIAGAECATDDNCDNGACVDGACTGGLSANCEVDSECLGYLYCTTPETDTVGTCGGEGTFCTDPYAGNPDGTAADNFDVYNSYCSTGFCSVAAGGLCTNFVTQVDADCSFDPDFACTADTETGRPLVCNPDTLTCQIRVDPTGARARARRAAANGKAALFKRRACPMSHTACAIEGAKGFECVDTASNLEQCGACASEGGVDCTSLPGAEAVGCVAGTCEIWSCADGYQFDSATSACVPVLA